MRIWYNRLLTTDSKTSSESILKYEHDKKKTIEQRFHKYFFNEIISAQYFFEYYTKILWMIYILSMNSVWQIIY